MTEKHCHAEGCTSPVPPELDDSGFCLHHYLADVEGRVAGFSRQVIDKPDDADLKSAARQFILLTAARIATIGVQAPPDDQMVRGRMLHLMLMLADLRERLDSKKR